MKRVSQGESGQVQAIAGSQRFAAKVDLCHRTVSSGDALRLRVCGTSMLPALWPGESVAVRKVNIESLEIGDVVVFARHDHFVVHRIVGWTVGATGTALITRGDAQLHDDAPVHRSELLGAVVAVHRLGADRPMSRHLRPTASGLAWIACRSVFVRSLLDRINSLLVNRAIAAQAMRANSSVS